MKTKPRHRSKTYFEPSTILLLRQIGVGFLVLSVVATVIALVWWGTRLEVVTIDEVLVEGGVTIDHDEVREKVNSEMSGAYLGLIPKRFVFFYPAEKIQGAVEGVERIRDVSVVRDGRELRVSFDEYLPEALWCDLSKESECLFLDAAGYAFAPAPVLQGASMLRYFLTERSPKERETLISIEDYDATKRFVALLEEIGWFVSRVEINQTRDVFYTLAQGGELKATLVDDPQRPFQNLQTILNSKEFAHLKPGNFQYLDLRFGTRVFVNEEFPEIVASSTATSSASSTVPDDGQ